MNAEERAVCAHMRVNYFTSEMDKMGYVHGWWKCLDCDMEFVPKPALKAHAKSERAKALREAARQIRNSLMIADAEEYSAHNSAVDACLAVIEALMEDDHE